MRTHFKNLFQKEQSERQADFNDSHPPCELVAGDRVLIREPVKWPLTRKLQFRFTGPYVVQKKLDGRLSTYLIDRTDRVVAVNARNLRKYRDRQVNEPTPNQKKAERESEGRPPDSAVEIGIPLQKELANPNAGTDLPVVPEQPPPPPPVTPPRRYPRRNRHHPDRLKYSR